MLHTSILSPKNSVGKLIIIIVVFSFFKCSTEDAASDSIEHHNVEHEILDIAQGTDIDFFEEDNSKKNHNSRTLKTINAAIRCSGLQSTVFSGTKTMVAPTDQAFAAIGLNESNVCQELDIQSLRSILSYHLIDDHVERLHSGCIEMIDGNLAFLNTVKRFKMAVNNIEINTIYNQSKSYYDLDVFMVDDLLEVPVGDLVHSISNDKDLSIFSDLISTYPEISASLSDDANVSTIFAPTDNAMRQLLIRNSVGTIDRLVDRVGVEVLQQILAYHLVDDCLFTSGFASKETFITRQGTSIEYNRFQNGILSEQGDVSRFDRDGQDIVAANGIIHKINQVLTPSLDISDSGLNARITTSSVDEVKATITSIFNTINAIGIAAEISHSDNAAGVSRELRSTELILFGNPRLGTPIMQANQQAGIDLPQKYLIYEDAEGDTRIAYNDIDYLVARHGLGDVATLPQMRGALNNFASRVSDRMPGPITQQPEKGEGLIDKISTNSFDDTYQTLVNIITSNPNLRLILELDHQANAARVGLDLRPTRLIVFGNPNLGTPLMQSGQTVGIDLPQKLLVWQDENQQVHITYNDPAYLQSRHGIRGNEEILTTISHALNNISNAGGGL